MCVSAQKDENVRTTIAANLKIKRTSSVRNGRRSTRTPKYLHLTKASINSRANPKYNYDTETKRKKSGAHGIPQNGSQRSAAQEHAFIHPDFS